MFNLEVVSRTLFWSVLDSVMPAGPAEFPDPNTATLKEGQRQGTPCDMKQPVP